jgi:hypothetical protein
MANHHPDRDYTLAELEAHCLAEGLLGEAERCAAYRSKQDAEEQQQPDRGDAWLDEKRDPYAEAHGL